MNIRIPHLLVVACTLLLALVACGEPVAPHQPDPDPEPEGPVGEGSKVPVWTLARGADDEKECLLALDMNPAGNLVAVYVNGCNIGDATTYGQGALHVEEFDANGTTLHLQVREDDYGGYRILPSDALVLPDGTVIVTGDTRDTPWDVPRGDYDFLVEKYDTDGNILWTEQFGSPGEDHSTAVALAADGSIYVVGHTTGELEGQTRSARQPDESDALLVKLDTDGNHEWTRQFGTAQHTTVQAVATDHNGNVYAAGTTRGQFPGNINSGEADAFVAKFTSDGVQRWVRHFGTNGYDSADGMALDSEGNLYVTGRVFGALPGQIDHGDRDAMLIKLNADGDAIWSRQFGTDGNDHGQVTTLASSGEVLVGGHTTGMFPGYTDTGNQIPFISRFTATGILISTFQYPVPDNPEPWYTVTDLISDRSGDMYLGGKFRNPYNRLDMYPPADILLIKYRP